MRSRFFGTALRATLVYFLLAGLWILFSDRLLAHWATGPEQLTHLQTYKGWGFVAVTGLGLYVLLSWRDRAEERLRYQAGLLTNVSDAIISTDRQFGIVSWNRAAETMLGWSANEAIGKRVSEVTKMEYVDTKAEIVLAEFQAHGSWSGEVTQRRKDGTLIYAQSSVTAIFDNAGKTIGAVAVNRDITQRKQAEQALHESEDRYRVLVEQSPDMIGVMDEQGLVYVNQSGVRLLGAERLEQLLGQNAEDFVHPEDRDAIRGRMRRIAEKGAANPLVEFRLIRLDGKAVQVESVSMPIVYQGKPATQFIARDITQRKQAENALKRSENEYRHLFDKANDVVLVFEPEQEIILEANGAACAAYGFDHDELVGMSLRTLTRNAVAGAAHIEDFLEGRPQNNFESIHFNKAGEDIHFLINCSLIEYRGERAILSIHRDITERKRMQLLQDAVFRIASAALTTGSLDDLYAEIHRIISGTMDARNFYITIYDAERDLLTFPYFKDAADAAYMNEARPEKGLTAYVLRTGKSLLCTQAVHDELERRGEVKLLGTPSSIWLGVPLIVQGQAIGAMVVQNYSNPAAYTEREQHMLEFVSAQVAVAIDRKRAEQALRERETRYRALFEDSPVSLWEEDFSAVKRRLDALRQDGITNFEEYFAAHPDVVNECVALVKVLDVNHANDGFAEGQSQRGSAQGYCREAGRNTPATFPG